VIVVAAVIVVVLVAVAGVGTMVWLRIDRRSVHLSGSGTGTTYLLVGSDSRAFVHSATDRAHFGAATRVRGERADIVLLVRKVGDRVTMLNVPRDLIVLTANDAPARYALTLGGGLQSLADVTCHSLGVGVDHVAVVHFDGLRDSIDAVGGIDLTFPTPLRDRVTGLSIPTAGRRHLDGEQALALVRSRTTEREVDGRWERVPPTASERGGHATQVLAALGARAGLSVFSPWSSIRKLFAFSGAITVDDGMGPFQLRSFAHLLGRLDPARAIRLPVRSTPGDVPTAAATPASSRVLRRFGGEAKPCVTRIPVQAPGVTP